jgi:WhiB family redox-sensing transcriptional regulator
MPPTTASNPAAPALDWRQRGACRDQDPELFFPSSTNEGKRQARRALAVCAACPVLEQCREWALSLDISDGILGGLTPRQRERRRTERGLRRPRVAIKVPRDRFDLAEITAAISEALTGNPLAARERLNATERCRFAAEIDQRVGRAEAARILKCTPNSIATFVHRDRQRIAQLAAAEAA